MNWLAFYNPAGVGDVLLLTRDKGNRNHTVSENKGPFTLVKDGETDQVVSINLHHASDLLALEGVGQIQLASDQLECLNQALKDQGIEEVVTLEDGPSFVVGYVEECVDHEDSDHLHITQTRVSQDQVLQIVCGAANITQGLYVIVAKPGAVMPSGTIIWPGELRGVASNGMICSTRELGLEAIENYPGIWELPSKFEIGTPLERVVDYYRD